MQGGKRERGELVQREKMCEGFFIMRGRVVRGGNVKGGGASAKRGNVRMVFS